jgi:hypothetical protein
MNQQLKAREAVRCAASYLRSCGIRVPRFRLTTKWNSLVGGSHILSDGRSHQLNMGRYPATFLRNWFAMHELGHLLWLHHHPLRRKGFRALNFAGDAQLENTLERFREELLTRSAEDYRNDRSAMDSLTNGLSRLRESAVQLARGDARDVLSRFGQMGGRRLAAVG